MSPIIQAILSFSKTHPEGTVLSAKEFLGHNSRTSVDQAFARLAKAGKLIRVSRGTYVAPMEGRFGKRPPAPEAVIQSIALKKGEQVATNGAAAANSFGLTTQVPVQEVFVTSGRSRVIRLGRRVVRFKHVPHWQTVLGNQPAGMAVRALAWVGPEHAPEALSKIRKKLSNKEWETMLKARSFFPGWLVKLLGKSKRLGLS